MSSKPIIYICWSSPEILSILIHEKNAKLGHDQMTAHLDGYFAIQGMVGAMANNMMAFSKLVISECVDPLANFSKEGTSTF